MLGLLLAIVTFGNFQASRPFVVNVPAHSQVCAPHSICTDIRLVGSHPNEGGSALTITCANWYEPGRYHGIGNRYLDFNEYIVGAPGRRFELWGRWENNTDQPQIIGEFYSVICNQV